MIILHFQLSELYSIGVAKLLWANFPAGEVTSYTLTSTDVFFFNFSGPDKHEDDDLIFEDFARLRLKESEHLGSAEA